MDMRGDETLLPFILWSTRRTLHAFWAVSSASCSALCFYSVSSPVHAPMEVGTPGFGHGDRSFLRTQNPTNLSGANSKTDSALTSNCIL
jgi:hypothetical protein